MKGRIRRKRLKASAHKPLPEPRTLMGQFLRATVLRWEEERVRLHREVKKAGSKDGNSVTREAFNVGVSWLFGTEYDVRDVSRLAADMRNSFGDAVPQLETEALIRQALGEETPTQDIGFVTEIGAKVLTLLAIADLWGRDESRINEMLVEAENRVLRKGFKPTLAP